MENKIILFTNIKGGVGKTTLCSLFATYLAQQNIPGAVMDADIQQSLFRHRQRELQEREERIRKVQEEEGNESAEIPAPNLPWQVQSVSTSDEDMVESLMQRAKKIPGWILIDCPGNINDHALKYIFQAADVAIIPFGYDADTLDATKLFCGIFKRVSSAKLMFVPNNIIVSDERRDLIKQDRDTAIKTLGGIGNVTPRIKHGVAVKSYSTIEPLDYWQEKAVEHSFKPLIEDIENM